MNTQRTVAPRIATIEPAQDRREGRVHNHRSRIITAVAGLALAGALGACSPGSSVAPLPSVVLPSVSVSAAASAVSQIALLALDQTETAIAANTNATGLSADEAASLTQLTAALRTALQTGDTTATQTALTNLTTKVDSFSAKLNTDAGKQLTAAIAALKAALPPS
jgi:hypothetical protein